MKQIMLACCLIFSLHSFGQQQMSVLSGVNFSNLNGDSYRNWDDRIGLSESIQFSFFVSEYFYFKTGLSYNQMGYVNSLKLNDENGLLLGERKTNENYDFLGISALGGLRTNGKICMGLFAGVIQSLLVNAKSKVGVDDFKMLNFLPEGITKDINAPASRIETGLQVGIDIGVKLNKRFVIFYEVSFYQGLRSFKIEPELIFTFDEVNVRHYSVFMGLGARFDLGVSSSKSSK